jgi:hypothetical protein
MLFLIEYDRPSGSLIQIQTFAAEDSAAVNKTRLALELDRLHTTSTREIVILDAESEAVLRKTLVGTSSPSKHLQIQRA